MDFTIKLKNGENAVIHKFMEQDKDQVSIMMESLSSEATKWGIPPYSQDRLETSWWSNLNRLIAIYATISGRVAGYAHIRIQTHLRRRGIGDYLIYLHQDFHNVGLGTAMTKYILGLAHNAGLHRVSLDVVADNKNAIHVYKKVGFKIEGTQKDAFYGDDEKYHDEVFMGFVLQ